MDLQEDQNWLKQVEQQHYFENNMNVNSPCHRLYGNKQYVTPLDQNN